LYQLNKEHNDIKEIRTAKHLERANLDYTSPKLKQACKNLGLEIKDIQLKYIISHFQEQRRIRGQEPQLGHHRPQIQAFHRQVDPEFELGVE